MKKSIVAIVMVLGMSTVSRAGFLLEPYVGYESGSQAYTNTTPTNYEVKSTATEVGLRIGYISRFFMTADVQVSSGGKFKYDLPAGTADEDYTRTIVGLDIGYYFTTMFRGYLGYGASNEILQKTSLGDKKYKGTSVKAGLGYHLHRNVIFTLEYLVPTYTKYSLAATESDIKDVFPTFDAKSNILVGFSFPMMW